MAEARSIEYRRPRPPDQFESLIDDVIDAKIFDKKTDVMVFAAALGRRFSERKPVTKKGIDARWDQFSDEAIAFVNALALAECHEISGLDPESDKTDVVTIFEEYMNGGFEYLQQNILQRPGDHLENLLAVLQEVRVSQDDVPSGLEGFDPSALRMIGDLDD